MHITRIHPDTDTDAMSTLYELLRRARSVDTPEMPEQPLAALRTSCSYGADGEQPETWVVPGEDGLIGAYILKFPQYDNTHSVDLHLTVDPAQRCGGYGRALLDHAQERVRTAGRRLMFGEAPVGSAGAAFAEAVGARHALDEPRRMLDTSTRDPAEHSRLLREATEAAEEYSLLSWKGATPEEHIHGVAALHAGISDAPTGELDWQDEVWDAGRVRAWNRWYELAQALPYTIVARHDATGELAGLTALHVFGEGIDHANQEDTVVLRKHRGHRLGLLMKLSMLDRLAGDAPHVRRIVTGNAATNTHMLHINELLGFRLVYNYGTWQLPVT